MIPNQRATRARRNSGGVAPRPTNLMVRALYIAIGFWVARTLFRRHALRIDPLARLRNSGF